MGKRGHEMQRNHKGLKGITQVSETRRKPDKRDISQFGNWVMSNELGNKLGNRIREGFHRTGTEGTEIDDLVQSIGELARGSQILALMAMQQYSAEYEDILALSDPPYYTACPNPRI